ncbi:PAS domain S-box protein [Haloarchaeobius sp. HRN-SO-5]|uniref:PAS domain S-box protein n=1 Tax=Haloarchaeobius sp. HRN-SO-5 TaxID=3446118 RepID=UPI003EB84A3F
MSTVALTDALRETLGVFESVRPGTPLTTSEVTEDLDVGRRSTYSRLERLADHGYIESKEVGARGRVWWRPVRPAALGAGSEDAPVDYAAIAADLPGMGYRARFDGTRTVTYISDACARVTGYDPDDVASGAVDWEEDVVHPDDVAHVRQDVAEGLEQTGRFTTQYRIEDAGGEVRWLWEHGRDVGDDHAVEGIVVELTDETWTDAVVRESERTFRTLVDSVDECAIVTLDADGHVQTWNDGAQAITGYDRDAALGEHVETFYTPADREADVPDRALAEAASGEAVTDDEWYRRADGSRVYANVTISGIHDGAGSLTGYVMVVRDLQERRERERELARERDHFDSILENSPNGIAVFRPDGVADRVNTRFADLLDLDEEAVADYELDDIVLRDGDGDPIPSAERPAQRTLATGERVSDQRVTVENDDGRPRWLSVDTAPITFDDGVGVVASITDVTQLEAQARRLERRRSELESELEDVFARIDDAFYALDDDLRFTYVNERAAALLDEDRSDLLGSALEDAFEGDDQFVMGDVLRRAMETQESVSYEEYVPPLEIWLQFRVYPSESGLSVYFSDVTGRKQREQELEEYERIIETVDDGIYVVDRENRYRFVNDAFAAMIGRSPEALVGTPISDVFDEDVVEAGRAVERSLRSGDRDGMTVEAEIETDSGESFQAETRFALVSDDDDARRVGVVRDVSDRVERQRELERYETIIETVDDGIYVLDDEYRFVLVNDAYVELTGYTREELLGAHCSHVVGEDISRLASELSQELAGGEGDHAVVEAEIPRDEGDGVLAESKFTALNGSDDGYAGSVGVVRDVTERRQRERAIERHREHLVVLNDLSRVVRDITDAVIEQSTREEIERVVCEGLAGADSYQFAWTGEVDSKSDSLQFRTGVGVDGPPETTISVDPDDEVSACPAGMAAITRELQTAQTVPNARFDLWPDGGSEVESWAAIPISYGGTLYGVLNVATDRRNAFTGDEEAVVRHLGEVVGHAIAAVERKRALLSDEVVELEFAVRDYLDGLETSCATDGLLTLERWVPAGDDTYLAYGTERDGMLDTLDALVEERPHLREVTVLEESEDRTRFELRMVEPPILAAITDHGGYIEQAAIRDGDYHIQIHLATSADVRGVIELVQDTFEGAQLVSRRQVSRDTGYTRGTIQLLSERLTDRQRTALEAAFYSGYFEWPRKSSGQDVADSMDITPPTFHQLLRKAHQRLLESVLAGSTSG